MKMRKAKSRTRFRRLKVNMFRDIVGVLGPLESWYKPSKYGPWPSDREALKPIVTYTETGRISSHSNI